MRNTMRKLNDVVIATSNHTGQKFIAEVYTNTTGHSKSEYAVIRKPGRVPTKMTLRNFKDNYQVKSPDM